MEQFACQCEEAQVEGAYIMEKEISVKRNFIMNTILNASSFIFPLITFPYVSRVLLPVGTGKVAAATSLIAYFAMVAQLGIPTYGIRACAKVRDDKEKLSKTVQELFLINLIMSAAVYVVFFVALFNMKQLSDERVLYVICSTTIVFNLLGMEWLYRGLEQYSYITVRSLLFKFIALILVFILIHDQGDYLFYGVTTIFAAAGSNVMNFINVRKYISLRKYGRYNFKQHIKPVVIFFAMSIATTVYTNLDTVMLKFIQGDAEVGYYNAAVKVKTIVVSLVTSVAAVLLPRVSYYVEQKKFKEFRDITAKAFNLVILMALPLVVYFIFYAREAIIFLSGSAYEPSILPMQIIMPTVFLIGVSNITGLQILVPLGKEHVVLISEIIGAGVNLILNALLIPEYGSIGAAFGTLVAEVVVLIVQLIALKTTIWHIVKKIKIVKILVACAGAWIVTDIVSMIPINSNIIMLMLTFVVYFVLYAGILTILKEPLMSEVMTILKRRFLRY